MKFLAAQILIFLSAVCSTTERGVGSLFTTVADVSRAERVSVRFQMLLTGIESTVFALFMLTCKNSWESQRHPMKRSPALDDDVPNFGWTVFGGVVGGLIFLFGVLVLISLCYEKCHCSKKCCHRGD